MQISNMNFEFRFSQIASWNLSGKLCMVNFNMDEMSPGK